MRIGKKIVTSPPAIGTTVQIESRISKRGDGPFGPFACTSHLPEPSRIHYVRHGCQAVVGNWRYKETATNKQLLSHATRRMTRQAPEIPSNSRLCLDSSSIQLMMALIGRIGSRSGSMFFKFAQDSNAVPSPWNRLQSCL